MPSHAKNRIDARRSTLGRQEGTYLVPGNRLTVYSTCAAFQQAVRTIYRGDMDIDACPDGHCRDRPCMQHASCHGSISRCQRRPFLISVDATLFVQFNDAVRITRCAPSRRLLSSGIRTTDDGAMIQKVCRLPRCRSHISQWPRPPSAVFRCYADETRRFGVLLVIVHTRCEHNVRRVEVEHVAVVVPETSLVRDTRCAGLALLRVKSGNGVPCTKSSVRGADRSVEDGDLAS